ncbi:unnamed protein product [Rotaria sp. Silwood2]|nr:unnamed protein product [Rotaria sp. Silwood2]
MQGYQQQLIVFSLFISIIYAKLTINSFEALAPITIITAPPTIYATHVQLWANVIDCPKNNCSCEVYTDKLGDNAQILTFMENKQDIGFVTIPNLEPNTLYEFTLNCKTNTDSATEKRNVTTDHGRPLAPQNVAAILVSKHIKIIQSNMTEDVTPTSIITTSIDQPLGDIVENWTPRLHPLANPQYHILQGQYCRLELLNSKTNN